MADEFVSFYIRAIDEDGPSQGTVVKIALKQPIKLYDDNPHSPYRRALARASRIAKRELGMHPCSRVLAEPDDWSDGVEEHSEKAWRDNPTFVPQPVEA